MVVKVIGNREYVVVQKNIPVRDLNFYIDNPRVYSLFDRSEHEPSQEEMEMALCNMDDVKELRVTIEKNGAIITPLIVKDGDLVVIEGNRRLAACRMLVKKDPIKWAEVPCDVYPSDLDDDAIFRILGICHLNGQKKWAPFEEASLIYRRVKSTGKSFKEIAESVGRPQSEIKKCYETYELMVKCGDLDSNHWSYYEEYLKNQGLKKMRKVIPNLDGSISGMIKTGQITDAKGDIREKLGKIAKMPESEAKAAITDVVEHRRSLDEVVSDLDSMNVDIYRSINQFRVKIMDPNVKKSISSLSPEEARRYIIDLKMIHSKVSQILSELERDGES